MIGEALGPYRIEAELGSGGMGKVYAATVEGRCPGLDDGARVALKVVHPHLLDQPGFFRRFLREAEIGASVEHANVVRTYLADALGAHHFLVMEYVEGQTLRDLLFELRRVPEELCRHIGCEVAKGLAAIHASGAVHRDLKPDNVLITAEHEVKVMDLGVARLQDEVVRLSQTGVFIGSVRYAAPEQFRGGDPDHRADLHALGLLLYELACGTHPYRGDDFRAVVRNVLEVEPRRLGDANPQLSPFFEEVVHTLLAKNRDERFPSAEELLAVLDEGEDSTWWRSRASQIRTSTKRPVRRIRIPRETDVYGRERELARLGELFRHAAAGAGQAVLVEGEAGIGKSRLVDELIGRLHADGEEFHFLFGGYPPGGAALSAGGFTIAFREQLGVDGCAGYLPQAPALVAGFDAVLRGEPLPEGAPEISKDAFQTCFVHVTRALAAERTTVVLIDDLHFAPEAARALFTSLALAVPGHRVLLLGTARPGLPEEWIANLTRPEHVTHLHVDRLGPKDLVHLLEDSFRSALLAEQLGAKIAVKSDGNPFFVFEIVRGLREGQFIARKDDGSWATTGVIEDVEIPSSVLDLVNARVAGLSREEREVLDVAACWGFEFDPLLVGDVLGLERVPLLRQLGQIERAHRLVRAAGRHYVFDHHQVQEALYRSLSEPLREEYHAALASSLETRAQAGDQDPAALDGALCAELCEHLFKGARGARGLRYLDAAQSHLLRGYRNAAAVELGDLALNSAGLLAGAARVDVLLAKADRLDLLGKRELQESALREAVELASDGDPEKLAGAIRALAWCLICQGRYDEAGEECRCSLELCRAVGDRKGEAMVTGNLGTIAWYRSRYDEAREHFERHLAISCEIGDRLSEAKGAGNLGLVLRDLGRLDEARPYVERHLAVSREIGYRGGEANATGNLGLLCWSLGRYDEAGTQFHRQLELVREIGDRRGEATATANLGLVAKVLGKLADARDLFVADLAISREIGDRHSEAIAHVNLGLLFASLGAPTEARARFDECVAICHETGAPHPLGYALHGLGLVAETTGDADAARQKYEEALALRRRIQYWSGVGDTLLALASLELEAGHPAAALPCVEEARTIAEKIESPGRLVLSAALRALLPEGEPAAAVASFHEHGGGLGHAEALQANALLFQATGDARYLAEAKRLLEFALDHAPRERRADMIANVPANRAIVEAWKEHGATGDAGH